ncbi:T9SS type A sorting domain-containing protein [Marivirga sp.]|uniref:T9SS type A sorting domain-containing protein n=1 Tax=Marivirga sp. TaxID=2018662 RepID=UPI003DA71816
MRLFYKSLLSIFLIINTVLIVKAQDYELNENFNSNVGAGFTGGSPNVVLMDSNGKYIVAGDFTGYNGTAREGLVRLNADGTLDTGFGDLSATFSGTSITDMEIDASDNIYISGTFTDEVLKIDNTGNIDGGFNFSRTNLSAGGTIQELGLDEQLSKLYIGQEVSGDVEIAQHLSSTGAEDNDFSVRTLTGTSAAVKDIAVDNNNDVYIVGRFNSVGIFSPINIARFDYLTGDFDQNFVPDYAQHVISSRPIIQIEINNNGDVYTIQNTSSAGVVFVKYQSDGSYVDDNFVSTTGTAPVELTDLKVADNDDYFFISGEFGVVYGDPATLSKTDFFVGNNFESSTTSNVKSILYNETLDEFIAVGDFDIYGGKTANTIAKLENCSNITIDQQPTNTTKCVGESAQLTVQATGTNLTYQWQENTNGGSGLYTDIPEGGKYSNTTSNILTISNIDFTEGHRYRVIISDADCNSTSEDVRLFVAENPTFDTSPADVTACQYDDGVEFTFTISGNTQNLQWQVKSTDEEGFVDLSNNFTYTGANSFTLKVDNINIEMNGNQYRVIAGGCETEVISDPATLTVNPAPDFAIDSGSEVALCDSGDISLTATSTNANLTYRWQIYNLNTTNYEDLANGGIYSGVNTETLQITGADNSMEHINSSGTVFYKCVATNSNTNCEGEASTRLIIVDSEPSRNRITRQPTNVTECDTNGSGRSVGFSLEADLENGEMLQWQVDSLDGNGFIDLDGRNNTSFTFTAHKEFSDIQYRAVVLPCNVVSDTVQAIIDEFPEITISGDIEACENTESMFVVDSDQANVSYQWEYFDSNSFIKVTEDNSHSGAKNDTLNITNNSGAMNRLYRCVVTSENGLCEKTSQSVRLIIYSDPNFNVSKSTGNLTVCEDSDYARIDRSLSNYDGINSNFFNYQWQVSSDGTAFSDLTNDMFYSGTSERVLSIDSAALDLDSNYYRLSITGCSSNFYSDTSRLFIEEAPSITAQPEDQIICFQQDEEAVFTVGTQGDNINILWERSETIDGSYSAFSSEDTLKLDGNDNSNMNLDGSYFRAVVTNGNNCNQSATSDTVQFIMNEVTLLQGPLSEVDIIGNLLCLESETYLYVNTRGESLNYQWQVDEGNGFVDLAESEIYSSVNDDTLMFIVTDENLNFNYQCIISGQCESITTSDVNISGSVVQSDIPIIESNRLENGDVELFVQNIPYNSLIWYDEDGNQLSIQERPLVNSTGIYSVEAILNGCGFMSEPFEVTETILSVQDAFNTKLYPNPVANRLKVDLGNIKHGTTKIMIYEANGTLIQSDENRTQNVSIDVSHLKKGMYFLILQSQRGTVKRKFIKE